MNFDELLDHIANWVDNPVIVINLSDSNKVDQLRNQLSDYAVMLKDLQAKYNALEYKYSEECQISLSLADKLRNLKKDG